MKMPARDDRVGGCRGREGRRADRSPSIGGGTREELAALTNIVMM